MGHQVTQLVHGQDEDFAGIPDHGGVEGHLSARQAELADEAAGAVHPEQMLVGRAVPSTTATAPLRMT